jgi:hypothetical protein
MYSFNDLRVSFHLKNTKKCKIYRQFEKVINAALSLFQ